MRSNVSPQNLGTDWVVLRLLRLYFYQVRVERRFSAALCRSSFPTEPASAGDTLSSAEADSDNNDGD